MVDFHNPLARSTKGIVSQARDIKSWARELMGLPNDAVVSVSELSCALPDCPPKETVILIMHGGVTRQVSMHLAITNVTRDDVAVAVVGSGDQ